MSSRLKDIILAGFQVEDIVDEEIIGQGYCSGEGGGSGYGYGYGNFVGRSGPDIEPGCSYGYGRSPCSGGRHGCGDGSSFEYMKDHFITFK